jgi:MraZ protein
MVPDHLFRGNAICGVSKSGGLVLPAFVRMTLSRRTDAHLLLVGCHESDPCLVAYDPAFAATLLADSDRRRIAEEGSDAQAHHIRARRIFGFVADVEYGESGACMLPPMMLRRARIDSSALVIGTGGAFEIWNPHVALDGTDPDLAELAAFHLDAHMAA